MRFSKLMTISLSDVDLMEQSENMHRQADEIVEKLGFTKQEALVAVELGKIRKKAVKDTKKISELYEFWGRKELIIDSDEYLLEKLFMEKDELIWYAIFYDGSKPTPIWEGKVSICEKELFELYKAEYLYENFMASIPRDYIKYYERCYGLAGIFKVFVNGVGIRKIK